MPPQRSLDICRYWARDSRADQPLDKHNFAVPPKCQLHGRANSSRTGRSRSANDYGHSTTATRAGRHASLARQRAQAHEAPRRMAHCDCVLAPVNCRRERPRGTSLPGCRRRSPNSTPCEVIGRRLERFRLRPMDGDWPCRQVAAATGKGTLRERRGSAANSCADTSRRCSGSGLAKRVQPARVSRLTRRRFRARARRFQSSLSEQRLISPTWRPSCPALRAGEFRRKPGNRHAGRNPVKCEPYSPATGEPEWPLGET